METVEKQQQQIIERLDRLESSAESQSLDLKRVEKVLKDIHAPIAENRDIELFEQLLQSDVTYQLMVKYVETLKRVKSLKNRRNPQTRHAEAIREKFFQEKFFFESSSWGEKDSSNFVIMKHPKLCSLLTAPFDGSSKPWKTIINNYRDDQKKLKRLKLNEIVS